jgi:hypothetical protein
MKATSVCDPYAIYALIDPRYTSNHHEIRYIGITNDVYARFRQHLHCNGANLEKDVWIKELKSSQFMLIMRTLEVVDGIAKARMREKYWIQHYKCIGAYLFNKKSIDEPISYAYKEMAPPSLSTIAALAGMGPGLFFE